MAVDLKIYDENVMKFNNDTVDIGESRMNYGTVKSFLLKNEGTDRAKNCIISASPYNTLDELKETLSDEEAEKEYNKQKMAASWKTFSLSEDGTFYESLPIGNIYAGAFLNGEETINENFSDEDDCVLQSVWSYCNVVFGSNKLKINKGSASASVQVAQRMSVNIGEKKNISFKFKLDYERDEELYANKTMLMIFPVRINSTGRGYILSFQFRANTGKVYFGVYKCTNKQAGMVSNLERNYGTNIINTNGFLEFDSSKFMGASIYTDDTDNICFEFLLNGEKQTLYRNSDKYKYGTVAIDEENNFPDAGLMYFDVGMYSGDIGITLSNFSITTETDKQPIYIKTKIDDSATDKEEYTSAISISYTEG